MKSDRWVASSQHLYRWLLHLYPLTYRTAYEEEMFHLFTDQCREAYAQRGGRGMLALWLRTLVDVGVTLVREHLSDPHAGVGLLEAMPNRPLPWKGVLLVLIPGLIFFISQVEQVTSNHDWYFLVFYRAGYFLILPALLVWLLTRRFPVWGLIPFGLLYATVANYVERFDVGALPFINDELIYVETLFQIKISVYDAKYLLEIFVCMVLLIVFIRHNARRGQISPSAWKWLGLYGLLVILYIAAEVYLRVLAYRFMLELSQEQPSVSILVTENFFQPVIWYFSDALPFLLLIFIGMLFARKYGGFSFLLLLGYLLPTVIYGRYGDWYEYVPFYMVGVAVVLYRFVVALAAPVWLVRAASLSSRQRAAAIPVAIAILCHVILNTLVYLGGLYQQNDAQGSLLIFAVYIWKQLITAAGLGLAVALYLPREQEATASPPTLVIEAE